MRINTFLLGLLLILVGVVAFLVDLGFGSWDMLRQVARLWPVLLILIGISLFWGGRLPRGLAFTLVVVTISGVILFMVLGPRDGRYAEGSDRLVVERSSHPKVTAGRIAINFGGGEITLGSATNEWARGSFQGTRVVTRVEEDNRTLKLSLRQRGKAWWEFDGDRNLWRVNVSPEIPWEIQLKAGAAKGDLDLTGIPLSKVGLELGAGDMVLKLGENGKYVAVGIDAGASDLKIIVPEDTGVSVKLEGALADTNLAELDWLYTDGRYISPGYENSAGIIDLDLRMAVGKFTLETVPATL